MSKESKVEAGFIEFDNKVKALRDQLANITDEDLLLFSDWLASNELATITEFIEAKAYDESRESETF
jgi:hypothetical protein